MNITHTFANLRGALALAAVFALAHPASAAVNPPSYPDRAHVSNGCHLSTITYLARLKEQYPAESGEPLVIQVVNYDGSVTSHTIALLTWEGQMWCRDEYFGVFRLGCKVDARPSHDRLVAKAETMLKQHEQKMMREGGVTPCPVPPSKMSAEQRTMEVRAMTQFIPFSTTVYWVHSGKCEVPLAFFRPAPGQVAVYDPQHGTCLGECSVKDDAKIVAAVAAKLGYQAAGLRADATNTRGTLVASNEVHMGGGQ